MRVKGFLKDSRRYTVIPFVLAVNLLAQLWSILKSQGAKRGSVDDQLTSRCRSHNKNSFWLESNKLVGSPAYIFTMIKGDRSIQSHIIDGRLSRMAPKPTIEHYTFASLFDITFLSFWTYFRYIMYLFAPRSSHLSLRSTKTEVSIR